MRSKKIRRARRGVINGPLLRVPLPRRQFPWPHATRRGHLPNHSGRCGDKSGRVIGRRFEMGTCWHVAVVRDVTGRSEYARIVN